MRECGFGLFSAKIIGSILAGDYFSHLDLGKNDLKNEGVLALIKALRTNCSLIHLDIGSNDITYEGAAEMFRMLAKNRTLMSLTMANHDRLHRNRLGPKSCYELRNLLQENQILQMVNIADNGISNEGLKILQPALTKNCILVSLNLSNNELTGIDSLVSYIRCSKHLMELNLSYNKIGDTGGEELAKIFQENSSLLMKVDLSACELTARSVSKLFFALKSNNFLKYMNLNGNNLSGNGFDQVSILLWNNRRLEHLSLAQCKING